MNGVFISYVSENISENIEVVDRLCQELRLHGIQVWRDRENIPPGHRWKREIKRAIQQGAFFIACFSKEYDERYKTYMNEELTIAIEELRQRPHDRIWFIPVKLNECEIPDRVIGGGEILEDLQCVYLYEDWDDRIRRILGVICKTAHDEYSKGVARLVNERTLQGRPLAPEEVQRNFEQAINHFSRALVKTDDAEVYLNRGLCFFGVNRIDDAINDFSRAIEIDSRLGAAYHNRGLAYCKKMYPDRAIEDFTKAIELDERLVYAYYSRGIVWLCFGNWEKAKSDLTIASGKGVDIIASFHNDYKSVEDFEQRNNVKLPADLAALLTSPQA